MYAVRDLKSKVCCLPFVCGFFSFLWWHLLSYYFNYEVEVFSEEINYVGIMYIAELVLTVFFLIYFL